MAKFFEAIGIKILEGYGLTETSPIISVNPLNNYKFGTVGKIIPGAEVKIMADKEIWVKGPGVTRGYYNNEENKENVSNGWFKTGDLGYLDKSGYLTIIGRKKEMIITSTGKNINPVDLENALQESKYVNQAMVYGDKEKYIKALIVPDFEELKIFSSNNELDNLEIFDLIKEEKILNLYRNEINNQLKEFADYEQVGEFKILDREFSEEKEELTPTLKLRRKKIIENFYEKRDR
jgi:long-chain acyl-CoA synthetase